MGQEGMAAATWLASTPVRRATIALLVLVAGVVSLASVILSPIDAAIAAWWPASGISVVALLASRGTRVAAAASIAAITAGGNLLGGRELIVAVLFGLANAIEAWIVARLLTGGGPEARLDSLLDVNRLIVSAAIGAVTLGVLAGAVVTIFNGQSFFASVVALLASHLSALLIVVPFGLVSRRFARDASPVEALAQVAFLTALLVATFWPGAVLPVAFVTVVALLWAAFRLPAMVLAIELVVMAGAVSTLTALGGGPFAVFSGDGTRTTVELLQLFFIVQAIASLYVSGARHNWANAVAQLATREALLRGGIVSAETGILIAENVARGRYRIIGVNAGALSALAWGDHPDAWQNQVVSATEDRPVFGFATIDELVIEGRPGRVEFEREGRGFAVDVSAFSEAGARAIVTLTFIDVTERTRREQEALTIAAELRELNQQKDGFIASVSHELRTPVTSILGFSEQLAESKLDDEGHQAARIIYRNARRLADVIEDVLELSSLTTTEGTSRPAATHDARILLQECVEDATGLVTPGRDVHVDLRVPEHPVIVWGVEQDFARVCANLLSNAVKFSPPGGIVTVTLTESGDDVELRIEDQGPGIPLAEQEAIWERFYRVQSDQHRDVPGTGLGLPIVRALVNQRLGGKVELHSDGEHGTTAIVRITHRHEPVQRHITGTERAADQAGAE